MSTPESAKPNLPVVASWGRRFGPLSRWAVLGWIVVFWRLGYAGLLDPDEAHYAQLTREMLHARSWLVPLLDGSPFIDKPVLFHWLQALAIGGLGESELAHRMPSAVAAIALVALTWWVAAQLFDARVAETAAAMFATLPATFALASVGLLDMLFTAFLFGGLGFLLVAALRQRQRLQYPGYVLITLAVMTKGPVALVLVILLFVGAFLAGKSSREAIQRLNWRSGLAFVVLAASPWFVWMSGRFGDRFVQEYLLAGNWWYFTSPARFSNRGSDAAFYARTFAGAFFPWSIVVVGSALDTIFRRRKVSTEELSVWLWMVSVIAFFTLARFKLDTYIFPAAPACAILAAIAWQRAAQDAGERCTLVAVVLVAACLIAGGAVAAVALLRLDLGHDSRAVLLPIALTAGGAMLMAQLLRRQWLLPRVPTTPVITLLATYAVVAMLGFPILERSRPTRPLGRWIARHTSPDTPIGIYGLEDWRASIRYYTQRPVTRLQSRDELRAFFEHTPTAYVLMLRHEYDRMKQEGIDLQEVAARPAIVGRSGKYIRRQTWGWLVAVVRMDYSELLASHEWDLK